MGEHSSGRWFILTEQRPAGSVFAVNTADGTPVSFGASETQRKYRVKMYFLKQH
jgi:hypothetical protein